MPHVYTFDFIVIGSASVGKSALLLRFSNENFDYSPNPTLGIELCSQVREIEGMNIKLRIKDTAGTEQYHSITKSHYRQVAAVLLVFSVTSRKSFQDIAYWLA